MTYCKDASHTTALTEYITDVAYCCMRAAYLTLPVTSPRATRGHIPGWSEENPKDVCHFSGTVCEWTVGVPDLATLQISCEKRV